MINSDPHHVPKEWGTARPLFSFALLAAVLLVGLSLASTMMFANAALSFGVFVLITGLGAWGLWVSYPHKVLGFCNGVTLIRAAMVAVLAGAIVAPDAVRWLVFALACVAFALDGLDGWLARLSGLSSAFGARFDMEIDALFGAVLALVLLSGGLVGPEILVLGFTRYAFVALSVLLPKLRGPLPESQRRKVICVIQITTLILLICPLTPVAFVYPVSVGVAALLLWSFAVDTYWLLRAP